MTKTVEVEFKIKDEIHSTIFMGSFKEAKKHLKNVSTEKEPITNIKKVKRNNKLDYDN